MLAIAAGARAGDVPAPGLYAITARLELPHLERWAVDRTRLACLADPARLPLPVLNAGTGLSGCPAEQVHRAGQRLSYRIVCPGRAAARAVARYELEAQGFRGRIAIVMGGKNMTMTEVQTARRLGGCEAATAAP
jgi:hypothetical protein